MLIFYLRRKKFSISFILLSLNYGALSTCGWIQKIIHNYFIILFEVACCKWVRKISETLSLKIKSTNPMQKHPYIIELGCIVKAFVLIFLLLIFFFISVEMCLTPKLSRYLKLLPFTCKDIQWVPIDLNSSRLTTFVPSLTVFLFVNKHLWIQVNFGSTFFSQNSSKDEADDHMLE